jgi:hypothetical protein
LGRGSEFELGGEHLFHASSIAEVHARCQDGKVSEHSHSTPSPNKERSFLPRLKDGGLLNGLVERVGYQQSAAQADDGILIKILPFVTCSHIGSSFEEYSVIFLESQATI